MFKYAFLALVLFANVSYADAKYQSEKNYVSIVTPTLYDHDQGFINIYSEDRIEIMAFKLNEQKDKLIGLCGLEPSLGLLILDGQPSTQTPPKVSDVNRHADANDDFVHSYVLKGDDAMDLMDLLHEYRSVGFALTTGKCEESQHFTEGKIIIVFDPRGIERAMKRIK